MRPLGLVLLAVSLVATAPRPLQHAPERVTVLVSSRAGTEFCNGADMDAEGYRRTLTVRKAAWLPRGQTAGERAKAVALASTSGLCRDVLRQLPPFRLEEGAVHVPPIDGWAGVSIVLCACRPEVEVNLLRLPGVTRVVWDADAQTAPATR